MNTVIPSSLGVRNTVTPITAGGKVGGNTAAKSADGSDFTTLFNDAVQEINDLDAVKNNDSLNLALGNVDDIAQVMVNAERAQTAFQLLVQVRNKLLDSYSEIMRMNV